MNGLERHCKCGRERDWGPVNTLVLLKLLKNAFSRSDLSFTCKLSFGSLEIELWEKSFQGEDIQCYSVIFNITMFCCQNSVIKDDSVTGRHVAPPCMFKVFMQLSNQPLEALVSVRTRQCLKWQMYKNVSLFVKQKVNLSKLQNSGESCTSSSNFFWVARFSS